MRSVILSTTMALAVASSSSSSTVDTLSLPANEPQQQQQLLWYPSFETTYEGGRCTTSPSAALLIFAAGAVDGGTTDGDGKKMGQNDKEGCCATWFPDQTSCGCLGSCPDDEAKSDTTASPSSLYTNAKNDEELTSLQKSRIQARQSSWYPAFSTTYESGTCVKHGLNTNEYPPTYYAIDGEMLFSTLEGCCRRWFEGQAGKACVNSLAEQIEGADQNSVMPDEEDDDLTTQPTNSMTAASNATAVADDTSCDFGANCDVLDSRAATAAAVDSSR